MPHLEDYEYFPKHHGFTRRAIVPKSSAAKRASTRHQQFPLPVIVASRSFNAMAGLPPRPVRPVLKWPGGFQIVDGNFTVDGIQWNPGTTLRLLFHPEDHLSCEMDLAATRAKAASLLADKPFLSAQLRFYGIAFRPSMSALDLKLLLKTAVENRLVRASIQPV